MMLPRIIFHLMCGIALSALIGCHGPTCRELGRSLPQWPEPPELPVRTDVLYALREPMPMGLRGERLIWFRFWPDGRAMLVRKRIYEPEWPTAEDGDRYLDTFGERGRYVTDGTFLYMEFCMPDGGRLRPVRWNGRVDGDGSILIHSVQGSSVDPPERYSIIHVGPMHRAPTW